MKYLSGNNTKQSGNKMLCVLRGCVHQCWTLQPTAAADVLLLTYVGLPSRKINEKLYTLCRLASTTFMLEAFVSLML